MLPLRYPFRPESILSSRHRCKYLLLWCSQTDMLPLRYKSSKSMFFPQHRCRYQPLWYSSTSMLSLRYRLRIDFFSIALVQVSATLVFLNRHVAVEIHAQGRPSLCSIGADISRVDTPSKMLPLRHNFRTKSRLRSLGATIRCSGVPKSACCH